MGRGRGACRSSRGALRLLDGDYPGREPMMKIAEFTTDRGLVLPR